MPLPLSSGRLESSKEPSGLGRHPAAEMVVWEPLDGHVRHVSRHARLWPRSGYRVHPGSLAASHWQLNVLYSWKGCFGRQTRTGRLHIQSLGLAAATAHVAARAVEELRAATVRVPATPIFAMPARNQSRGSTAEKSRPCNASPRREYSAAASRSRTLASLQSLQRNERANSEKV